MTVNCATHPITISFGRTKTTWKSLHLSVRPIPNIMTMSK